MLTCPAHDCTQSTYMTPLDYLPASQRAYAGVKFAVPRKL